MGDHCEEGGEAPCMAHLLDEDGRLDAPDPPVGAGQGDAGHDEPG